ncbi:hypothetical protein KQI63_05845 [bacterium]|nr:hypothetical protein [bacterium]
MASKDNSNRILNLIPKGEQWPLYGNEAEDLFVRGRMKVSSILEFLHKKYPPAEQDIPPPSSGQLYRWKKERTWDLRRAEWNQTPLELDEAFAGGIAYLAEQVKKATIAQDDEKLKSLADTLAKLESGRTRIKAGPQFRAIVMATLQGIVLYAQTYNRTQLAAALRPEVQNLFDFIVERYKV